MYLEHITVFLNLTETMSFSKTALNMHMSQSSVSQAISTLEKNLGLRLFIRDRKGVKVTAVGQDLYKSLKPWLNEYYKAIQHARNIESQSQSQLNLTIGYSGTPFEYAILPQIIKTFCSTRPNIKIFLENYSHSVLIEHLKNRNCDVIFTMPDIIKGVDGLNYTNLEDGYYCLITPKKYQKNFKTPIHLSKLDGSSLIFLDHRWSPPTQTQLQHKILKNNKKLILSYVNNISTAHVMVKSNAGLGIWANFVQDPQDTDLVCSRLDTEIKPKYGVATLKCNQNQATKAFIKWIEQIDLENLH